MKTSIKEISEWFDEGKSRGSTHMLVVCDTFDWEDYPVYVEANEDVREKYICENIKNMQRVMEVYNLGQDKESQLNEKRVFNF